MYAVLLESSRWTDAVPELSGLDIDRRVSMPGGPFEAMFAVSSVFRSPAFARFAAVARTDGDEMLLLFCTAAGERRPGCLMLSCNSKNHELINETLQRSGRPSRCNNV
jgi:hypothetical protein